MQDYVTLHLTNITKGREADADRHFEEVHVPAVKKLRGFKDVQRFTCSPHQLMPIIQPWTHATLYNFTLADPSIDLPAIAPLLADVREAGITAADDAERTHSYRMYHPWKYSSNYTPGPLSHLMFLLANFTPGREAEYHQWYDDVHSVEVSESPGYVGMRRGRLCEVQVPPVRHCPGDQLILGGIQVDDAELKPTLQEFFDRAEGKSPSGVAWGPRSGTASIARTVHIFKSISGPHTA